MKKIKQKIISLKNKPYKIISFITLLIFVAGISAFAIVKNNQIKAYSGTPYSGMDKNQVMALVDASGNSTLPTNPTMADYLNNIEKYQVVNATEADLGFPILQIPYRVSSGKIPVSDSKFSIPGQYGFIPKWTPGKTKVYLYRPNDTDPTKRQEVLNDGTKATTDATSYVFTQDEINAGCYIKFTYMGIYKNEWIDVVVKPQSTGDSKTNNNTVSVGYGKDASVSDIKSGAYLSIANTSAQKYTPDADNNYSNDFKTQTFVDGSTSGSNVNYAEINLEFYKTIENDTNTTSPGLDMTGQKKIKVQGFFTFGDFDFNESIGLDKTQVNQLFVLKPDKEDDGKFDIEQNQMIYGYWADSTPKDPVKELEKMNLSKFYEKPSTMVKNGDPGYESTLYYIVQRYGVYNNAYTQLMYTRFDNKANSNSTSTFNNDNMVFFNRGYISNTDASIKGAWLSFTYKETDSLHLSINASRALDMRNGFNSSYSGDYTNKSVNVLTMPYPENAEDSTSSLTDKYPSLKSLNRKYGFNTETQDYYVIGRLGYELGYTNSTGSLSTSSSPNRAFSFFRYVNKNYAAMYPATVSSATGSTVGYVARSMIPILPLDPVKTATVDNSNKKINWTVQQNIPVEYSETNGTTANLEIIDYIPKYWTVDSGTSGIKVTNLADADASKYFNVTIDSTSYPDIQVVHIEAKEESLNKTAGYEDFYVDSYKFSYTTSIDPSVSTDDTKKAAFNQLYYKDQYTIKNLVDASKNKDVTNSYVILNQAILSTSKIYLDNYISYSTPEFITNQPNWDSLAGTSGTEKDKLDSIPDEYKTAAVLDFKPTITINKTGETVGTGQQPLPGAKFKVYTKSGAGEKVYLLDSKGAVQEFTSGSDGKVTVSDYFVKQDDGTYKNINLQQATYYVEEIEAPAGYEVNDTEFSVEIKSDDDHVVNITNDRTRDIGTLNVTKDVLNSSGSSVSGQVVNRGDSLDYVITIQNTTTDFSRINNISLKDILDANYLEVDTSSKAPSMTEVENIGTASDTFTQSIGDMFTQSSNTLELKNKNINLEQQQQIRVKIPVKVKEDAEPGEFKNSAVASGTGGANNDTATKESNEVTNSVGAYDAGELTLTKGVSSSNTGVDVNKDDNATVKRGDTLYYTIIIKNTSSKVSQLDKISVEDQFDLNSVTIDKANAKMTQVEDSSKTITDASDYTVSLPANSISDSGLLTLSNITLREGKQIRVLVPVKVRSDAAPGTFTNKVTSGTTESNEVKNNIGQYDAGKLAITKGVSDSKTSTNNNDKDGAVVQRGDILYYTLTVKNTSATAETSLISSIVVTDTFDLKYISLENLSDIKMTEVETIGDTDTSKFTKDVSTTSSYDNTTGKLSIDGIELRENQQVRILIPINVLSDAPTGLIKNIAFANGTGGENNDPLTEVKSSEVSNELLDLNKTIFIRQVVVNSNKSIVVPNNGYFSIENVETGKGKGTGSIVKAKSVSTTDKENNFTELTIPYSNQNGSYYFDVICPQMYKVVGYTSETTSTGDVSNAKPIDTIFDYSGNGPYYITVFVEPNVGSSTPFYNWSYKDNLFGKIKIK